MILAYIKTTIRNKSTFEFEAIGHFELHKDQRKYYGEIPQCKGVFTTSKPLEDCRDKLEEILEEWIHLRILRNLPIPSIV